MSAVRSLRVLHMCATCLPLPPAEIPTVVYIEQFPTHDFTMSGYKRRPRAPPADIPPDDLYSIKLYFLKAPREGPVYRSVAVESEWPELARKAHRPARELRVAVVCTREAGEEIACTKTETK